MSNTNLVLGSNWSLDEWPEYVAVSHEGTCEGMRVYVPERTCRAVIVDSGCPAICSACGTIVEKTKTRFVLTLWNHSNFMNYCPNCGAKVVGD